MIVINDSVCCLNVSGKDKHM